MRKRLFGLICFGFSLLNAGEHKIIYMITSPRTMSTAFLRMMDNRGDFAVYNEQMIAVYNHKYESDGLKKCFNEFALDSFDKVKQQLFEGLKKNNLFVKEMSFSVKRFLIDDQEFIRNPKIQFVFLVRNPHASLISFYKKCQEQTEDLDFFIGLKELYELFQVIKQESPNAVKILFTEDLSCNAHSTIEAFCSHYQLSFKESQLHWNAYDCNFTGMKEWHESKFPKYLMHWHSDAIFSTGFTPLKHYDLDEKKEPTFSEVENLKHRKELLQSYHTNIEYYQKLREETGNHLLPCN